MPDDDAFLELLRLRLRSARLARNLRQEDVAERTGMELRNYQRLESLTSRRRFNPTLLSLRGLANAVGISLSELVRDATLEELASLDSAKGEVRTRAKRE